MPKDYVAMGLMGVGFAFLISKYTLRVLFSSSMSYENNILLPAAFTQLIRVSAPATTSM